ncbi:MAG: hypothetical protein M1823_000050 [Watsoniomyces obsoletus]|nr:MAG: hypothetical protein M1823_000050 [Watsoniomyces obsoletus]
MSFLPRRSPSIHESKRQRLNEAPNPNSPETTTSQERLSSKRDGAPSGFASLPPEILNMIFGELFEEVLLPRCSREAFYNFLPLEDAVRISRPWRAVCGSWSASARDVLFTRPLARRGVLLLVRGERAGDLKQVFPALSGCVVNLGDPNNVGHVERLHASLSTLSHQYPMDFISAVMWDVEKMKRPSEWELPLGEGCMEMVRSNRFGPVFRLPGGAPGDTALAVNDWVIDFMYRELRAFAHYHANLVLSVILLTTPLDHLTIPAFVITTLAEPATEFSSAAMRRTQRVRLLPPPSLAVLQTARFLEIYNGPHALNIAFTERFLPPDFRPFYQMVDGWSKWDVRRFLRETLKQQVNDRLTLQLERVCRDSMLRELLPGHWRGLSIQNTDPHLGTRAERISVEERERWWLFFTEEVVTMADHLSFDWHLERFPFANNRNLLGAFDLTSNEVLTYLLIGDEEIMATPTTSPHYPPIFITGCKSIQGGVRVYQIDEEEDEEKEDGNGGYENAEILSQISSKRALASKNKEIYPSCVKMGLRHSVKHLIIAGFSVHDDLNGVTFAMSNSNLPTPT